MPKVLTLEDVKPLIGNPARPNIYLMEINIPTGDLGPYLSGKGVSQNFIARESGILAFAAQIPGSSVATFDSYNLPGVKETFAHTQMYDAFNVEFLVQNNYETLKFFEGWKDYIFSGLNNVSSPFTYDTGQLNRYKTLKYPNSYKSNAFRIHVFENSDRNLTNTFQIKNYTTYEFVGVFPKAVNPVALGYDLNNEYMRVSVEFSYDRHFQRNREGSTVNFFNEGIGFSGPGFSASINEQLAQISIGNFSALLNF